MKNNVSIRLVKTGWIFIILSFLSSGGMLSSLLYKMSLIESKCFKNDPITVTGVEFTVPALAAILGLLLVAHEFVIMVLERLKKK